MSSSGETEGEVGYEVIDKEFCAMSNYAFEAAQDGDLALIPGQIVRLLDWETDWWIGLDHKGREGQFPANYVKKMEILGYAKPLFAFVAQEEGQLNFITGTPEAVVVFSDEGSWWKGSFQGEYGIFPTNYVSLLPIGKTLVALQTYFAQTKGEITFTKGDKMKVLEAEPNSEFWKCFVIETKVVGWVPYKLVGTEEELNIINQNELELLKKKRN